MRRALPLLGMLAAALGTANCGQAAGIGAGDLDLRTDSTTYKLRYTPGLYWIDMLVTVTNRSARDVYLHRACGYGEKPHRELRRTDDSDSRIWLGVAFCITQPLQLPIRVRAGETYVDEFSLPSTESPNATPPITMDERTGRFQLEYFIQTENRVEGWDAVELLPLSTRLSNSFRVDPP